MTQVTPPGWYPDPGHEGDGPRQERWWDGGRWTDSLRPAGGPGAPAPQAAPGWGGPAPWAHGQPYAPPPKSRRTARTVVAAVVGLVVLMRHRRRGVRADPGPRGRPGRERPGGHRGARGARRGCGGRGDRRGERDQPAGAGGVDRRVRGGGGAGDDPSVPVPGLAGADLCAQRGLLDARPGGGAEGEDGARHGGGRHRGQHRGGVRRGDVREDHLAGGGGGEGGDGGRAARVPGALEGGDGLGRGGVRAVAGVPLMRPRRN